MRCPSCKTASTQQKEVEPSLMVSECTDCGGYWLSAGNYWRWLDQHGETLPEKTDTEIQLAHSDSDTAKVCPDCGHLLMRFAVGHSLDFRLDRCTACGGIWLDAQEWEALKARNLHDEIHFIFSDGWQQQVRKEDMAKQMDALRRKLFGETDFLEIQRIKAWLDAHPKKDELIAYITDAKYHSGDRPT